jgi:aryl-alcohol dehydrogenase-like predicted oxidoreductase
MRTRTLGRTGLEVSEIGLGGLFVSRVGATAEEGIRATRRALELGITYVDTAPGYADSEEVLGRALEGVSSTYILSTKLGGRPQPFLPRDRECLMRSVEESLRLLKRDTIDILMIHEPDRPGQYDWWTDWDDLRGPVLDLLDDLKRQRVIRFTGLGGTTAHELPRLMRSGKFDVVLTAFNYSLLWREAEIDVIPAAIEQGMGIVIGSPLQQGALARRYDEEVANGAPWLSSSRRAQYKALYRYLDDLGIFLPELAMRFVLSNPHVSSVLTGARSVAEVEANVAAVRKGPLPREILARLGEIAAMVPFRPFEEPFGLPFGRGDSYRGPGSAR